MKKAVKVLFYVCLSAVGLFLLVGVGSQWYDTDILGSATFEPNRRSESNQQTHNENSKCHHPPGSRLFKIFKFFWIRNYFRMLLHGAFICFEADTRTGVR